MVRVHLEGEKFGKLTVIEFSHIDKKRQWRWVCLCECGKKRIVESYKLRNRTISSCGCNNRKYRPPKGVFKEAHGGRINGKVTPEYRSWQGMKDRCYNSNCEAYPEYGGRGITVCKRWLESFQNFFADMGKRPTLKHTLDRYPNNDGNYEPNNCRWGTKKQQAGNRRSSHWLEIDGERLIVADAAIKLKISQKTIYNRINTGRLPNESGYGKLVLDNQTGIFYNSAKEAAAAKNMNAGSLRCQLSGNCKNQTSLIYA